MAVKEERALNNSPVHTSVLASLSISGAPTSLSAKSLPSVVVILDSISRGRAVHLPRLAEEDALMWGHRVPRRHTGVLLWVTERFRKNTR